MDWIEWRTKLPAIVYENNMNVFHNMTSVGDEESETESEGRRKRRKRALFILWDRIVKCANGSTLAFTPTELKRRNAVQRS